MAKFTKRRAFGVFIVLAGLIIFSVFALTKKTIFKTNACGAGSLSGEGQKGPLTAVFEGKEITVPEIASNNKDVFVLGQSTGEKWIEVDLSEQKLRAWDGDNLFLETLVSTGLPWWPTPKGEFKIWSKVRATKMEGGTGRYYYNLPNVPYVMFFENQDIAGSRGFSLHGTYWHNDFGNVHSHGCVNLPTPIAEKLYYWAAPTNTQGSGFTRASEENQGTRVVIHE